MNRFLADVEIEVANATAKYPPMNSAHEGLAVLQEEVFEVQVLVYQKQSKHDYHAMYHELVQVAAMAMRMATDIAEPGRNRVILNLDERYDSTDPTWRKAIGLEV